MQPFYPRLDIDVLLNVSLVRRHLAETPTFLNDPGCPYSLEIKAWFEKSQQNLGSDVQIDDLQTEVESLFKQLKELGKSVEGAAMPTNEKLAYMRTATTLLEKLVALQERAKGVKDNADFEKAVLAFCEDVLAPEQRTIFMDRLREAAGRA